MFQVADLEAECDALQHVQDHEVGEAAVSGGARGRSVGRHNNHLLA